MAIYLLAFVYPTIQMFRISFTDAPLIGEGQWVGLDNYLRLDNDPMFRRAVWNTAYFVLMTVIPGTLIALIIALGVSRLKGRFQAMVLALFFLPYILPVSVVYLIWDWTLNFQFGIAMHVLDWLGIPRVPVFKSRVWFLPAVAGVTIWWTAGFSILLFLAGLRAIPAEIHEAAALDNSTRWTTFRRITWPLLWPVTSWSLPSSSSCSSRSSIRSTCSRPAAVRTTTWCSSTTSSKGPSSRTREAGRPLSLSPFSSWWSSSRCCNSSCSGFAERRRQ